MKIGFIAVAALLASALGAHFLLGDPGSVVIQFRGYVVEMTVPVMLGLLAATLVSAWLAIKIVRAPRKLGQAAGRYRSGRAGTRLTRGLIQMAEGNYARGEKLLTGAAGVSDAPLLNYLAAARAAHLMGETERRDRWLRQAFEETPEAENAVLLTQAEFQIDKEQYESALATLRRIEESAPNHPYALTLLGRLYFRLRDWRHLNEILPRLRKYGQVDGATLDTWEIRVHREELAVAPDGNAVRDRWAAVPRKLREHETLLEAYFSALKRTGADDLAEKELTVILKRRWEPALVELYGRLESSDPQKQLKRAESWLADHPDDPDLLLAAARQCLRNELWGKARSYLETVITLRASPDVYQEYGRLLTRLGEGEAAAIAYQEGLSLVASSTLPAIPHLPDGGSADR